jgi:hypothetical protein
MRKTNDVAKVTYLCLDAKGGLVSVRGTRDMSPQEEPLRYRVIAVYRGWRRAAWIYPSQLAVKMIGDEPITGGREEIMGGDK